MNPNYMNWYQSASQHYSNMLYDENDPQLFRSYTWPRHRFELQSSNFGTAAETVTGTFPGAANGTYPGGADVGSVSGASASASGASVSELGTNANASGQSVCVLEQNVSVLEQNVSVLEQNVSVLGPNVSVVGQNVSAFGGSVRAIAQNASVLGQNGSVLGQNGSVLGQNGSVLGQNGSVLGQNGSVLGQNGSVLRQNTSVLGQNASAEGQNVSVVEQSVSVSGANVSAGVSNQTGTKKRNAWGDASYADLLTQAINSSPQKRLTLSEIYVYFIENIPYFYNKGDCDSSASWKNSIRHNLSLHGKFIKVQNEESGKSCWWMLNNEEKPKKSLRKRAVSMANKLTKGLKTRVQAFRRATRNDPTELSMMENCQSTSSLRSQYYNYQFSSNQTQNSHVPTYGYQRPVEWQSPPNHYNYIELNNLPSVEMNPGSNEQFNANENSQPEVAQPMQEEFGLNIEVEDYGYEFDIDAFVKQEIERHGNLDFD